MRYLRKYNTVAINNTRVKTNANMAPLEINE